MYRFITNEGGIELTLNLHTNEYEIYVNGHKKRRDLNREQLTNPLVAVNEYSQVINEYLRDRVKQYLEQSGADPIRGCTIPGMKCAECRAKGYNRPGTRCIGGEH